MEGLRLYRWTATGMKEMARAEATPALPFYRAAEVDAIFQRMMGALLRAVDRVVVETLPEEDA